MQTATISEIKKALKELPPEDLAALCLRLGKYKLENKELLTYLIFEEQDEEGYIAGVKEEMEEWFANINVSNIYYAKKGIRKALRLTNKHIKYSGQKQTEVELLSFFCELMRALPISLNRSTTMANLYDRQLAKIEKALSKLHEDLQYDYQETLNGLQRV